MSAAMTALGALKTALAAVPGVATCKIGMEANMTPADYPMVRIVPSLIRQSGIISQRDTEVLIYFGQPVHEFSAGLEALYEQLFTLEDAILAAAQSAPGIYFQWVETIADEDRLDGYKLMAVRATVAG